MEQASDLRNVQMDKAWQRMGESRLDRLVDEPCRSSQTRTHPGDGRCWSPHGGQELAATSLDSPPEEPPKITVLCECRFGNCIREPVYRNFCEDCAPPRCGCDCRGCWQPQTPMAPTSTDQCGLSPLSRHLYAHCSRMRPDPTTTAVVGPTPFMIVWELELLWSFIGCDRPGIPLQLGHRVRALIVSSSVYVQNRNVVNQLRSQYLHDWDSWDPEDGEEATYRTPSPASSDSEFHIYRSTFRDPRTGAAVDSNGQPLRS